jgi:hypothetical protein
MTGKEFIIAQSGTGSIKSYLINYFVDKNLKKKATIGSTVKKIKKSIGR